MIWTIYSYLHQLVPILFNCIEEIYVGLRMHWTSFCSLVQNDVITESRSTIVLNQSGAIPWLHNIWLYSNCILITNCHAKVKYNPLNDSLRWLRNLNTICETKYSL